MKLSSLAPDHLECRSMGHAWKHVTDRDHRRKTRNHEIDRFWRDEECLRCGAERAREVNISGDRVIVERTRMRYPTGYLITGASRRTTRADALGAQYGREVWL